MAKTFISTSSLVLVAGTLRAWLAGEAYRQSLAARARGLQGWGLLFGEKEFSYIQGTSTLAGRQNLVVRNEEGSPTA